MNHIFVNLATVYPIQLSNHDAMPQLCPYFLLNFLLTFARNILGCDDTTTFESFCFCLCCALRYGTTADTRCILTTMRVIICDGHDLVLPASMHHHCQQTLAAKLRTLNVHECVMCVRARCVRLYVLRPLFDICVWHEWRLWTCRPFCTFFVFSLFIPKRLYNIFMPSVDKLLPLHHCLQVTQLRKRHIYFESKSKCHCYWFVFCLKKKNLSRDCAQRKRNHFWTGTFSFFWRVQSAWKILPEYCECIASVLPFTSEFYEIERKIQISVFWATDIDEWASAKHLSGKLNSWVCV